MGSLFRRKKLNPGSGQREPTGPWIMKLYDHGRPISTSTRTYSRRDALRALLEAEGRVAAGQRLSTNLLKVKFDDLVPLIERDYRNNQRRTWKKREQNLTHLRRSFGGMYIMGITTERLERHAEKRQRDGVTNATINREFDCLHHMMVLGQRRTPPLVTAIPYFPRLAENNVREGFFEHSQYLKLLDVCAPHLKVPITILYHTGMRKGEVITKRGIRWDQVDLTEGTIRLQAVQTKTKTPRVIYMVEDFLMMMIKAKLDRDAKYPNCPYVCHYKGKPIEDIKRAWKTACQNAGLWDENRQERKLLHDLRRTGARNLVRSGVSETVAMVITGHKTRSVFARYNITSEDDLKQAATSLVRHLKEKTGALTGADEGKHEKTSEAWIAETKQKQ